jgi:hypothetical protein
MSFLSAAEFFSPRSDRTEYYSPPYTLDRVAQQAVFTPVIIGEENSIGYRLQGQCRRAGERSQGLPG